MRKSKIVKAPSFCGRDHARGTIFLLTEWPAKRAEQWAIRATFALTRNSNVRIPLEWRGVGWEGLAVLGMNAFLAGGMSADEVLPILEELLECVTIIRDPKAIDPATGRPIATPIVTDDDIEEVLTRGWLRSEVFELHSGFSIAGALSSWFSKVMSRQEDSSSSTTQTSPTKSDSPSPETPASSDL